MKSNHQDIIEELKELQADILLKDKLRLPSENVQAELSEDFFQSVMNNADGRSGVISMSPVDNFKTYTRILKIAASFIVLLAVSGIIYSVVVPKTTISTEQNLQQLISQTSSQEILEYLYESGVPSDEDFLYEYVEESALTTKN